MKVSLLAVLLLSIVAATYGQGECGSNPCENGSVCRDGEGTYICECQMGYDGQNCDRFTGANCGYNIFESTGVIESPNYPANYNNRADCLYLVRIKGARVITFTIEDFATEIFKDAVEYGVGPVADFNQALATFEGNLTANNQVPPPFSVQGEQAWFIFSTDRNIPRKGFRITFSSDGDDCTPNPCLNGATCVDQVNDYQCICAPGFTGDNCETDIDECASAPCRNGGACVDQVNGYTCNCIPGFNGVNCENNINECASIPCLNGGICVDGINQFACTCLPGYTGILCETDINECASSPCQNGGSCTDAVNRYTCDCRAGFTGSNCETNINECASSPCLNGGSCLDGVDGYVCQCLPNYTGTHCEISLDACASLPCQNGGVCTNVGGDYVCECLPGYTGINCEIDINECASLPCQNGGECINGIAMYICQCRQGYAGVNCEEVGFCDLEGVWFNECNDQITIIKTSTGMMLGDHMTFTERELGVAAPTVMVGYPSNNYDFPSFGITVVRDNGRTTTSWTGQCHLCDGQEVLYTTWIESSMVSTCEEIKRANKVGQDKWTRYEQSFAPQPDA
ncbi:fibropellin-3 precursor [Strongylocentrotus purpuratus]|uniref:Fibropellin-3 n=1 Tax=Strongylocentrotus purpuratus TaxID=7668 RepID=FBP3_STRPU|nr:fibropellin-3 precursor [Strongylocentrotus purpuratus]P49013.1 RecName: Full=Fibropellin-3; AltName: Full=Epidermal growth factor-related protein 3; AltName: Full=Fibropellin III; AltName: Full=Fibropellin-c; AltName: Full=SpEGF III; Flags: Precursor [Strongylocentrotus purpuratus]AAA30045.1 fibropellin c [Strongylocentrotus purpuratus]